VFLLPFLPSPEELPFPAEALPPLLPFAGELLLLLLLPPLLLLWLLLLPPRAWRCGKPDEWLLPLPMGCACGMVSEDRSRLPPKVGLIHFSSRTRHHVSFRTWAACRRCRAATSGTRGTSCSSSLPLPLLPPLSEGNASPLLIGTALYSPDPSTLTRKNIREDE
jgi:hypothetical protein